MDDGQSRFVCPQCGVTDLKKIKLCKNFTTEIIFIFKQVKYKKISGLRGHMKECGRGAQCPIWLVCQYSST